MPSQNARIRNHDSFLVVVADRWKRVGYEISVYSESLFLFPLQPPLCFPLFSIHSYPLSFLTSFTFYPFDSLIPHKLALDAPTFPSFSLSFVFSFFFFFKKPCDCTHRKMCTKLCVNNVVSKLFSQSFRIFRERFARISLIRINVYL